MDIKIQGIPYYTKFANFRLNVALKKNQTNLIYTSSFAFTIKIILWYNGMAS